MKVICISAKARHGKDISALFMKEYLETTYNKKVLITHYADLLKFICTNYFDWDGNKDEEGRSLLQAVGTDGIAKVFPNFWVDFVLKILKVYEKVWDYVLIPDCRYLNEITEMQKNFETKVLRINRPGVDNRLTEKQKKHTSEVALDDYPFEQVIENDSGLPELREKLIKYLENNVLH